MKQRIKILFKINNEVVVEETTDLTITEIENMKWKIAQECECAVDEIETENVELEHDISDSIDVSADGLFFWKSIFMETIQGLSCDLEIGSDKYLDAMNNGTLEDYLTFFI